MFIILVTYKNIQKNKNEQNKNNKKVTKVSLISSDIFSIVWKVAASASSERKNQYFFYWCVKIDLYRVKNKLKFLWVLKYDERIKGI